MTIEQEEKKTVREQVQAIISKPFEEYNMHDVVELSRLKMRVWNLVAEAESAYLVAEQEYKNKRNALYILNKQQAKTTDKSAEADAYAETAEEKIVVVTLEGKLKELKNYYNDLNDVLIAVRMCQRRYDDSVNTQT